MMVSIYSNTYAFCVFAAYKIHFNQLNEGKQKKLNKMFQFYFTNHCDILCSSFNTENDINMRMRVKLNLRNFKTQIKTCKNCFERGIYTKT